MTRGRKPPSRNPGRREPAEEPQVLELASGVNPRGEPFVHVAWGDQAGQWTVEECRSHGTKAFEAAEAAEHDAAVFAWLTTQMDLPLAAAAAAIADLRQYRQSAAPRREAGAAPDPPPSGQVVGQGLTYGTDRARPELLDAAEPGKHLWIAATTHVLSEQSAAVAHDGCGPVLLDAETVATVGVGCYVCEEPYSPELAVRPCPGDPPASRS